jgi:hypothetical protein
MSSTRFMQGLPDALRLHLPEPLSHFKWRARSWLTQVYYDEPDFHFEVWALPGNTRLELGLHFESRNRLHNSHLLRAMGERLVEIKARLGPQVEVEAWDKGWSKVYETVPRAAFTPDYMASVAARLAELMTVLQPMLEEALPLLPTATSLGSRDNGHEMD